MVWHDTENNEYSWRWPLCLRVFQVSVCVSENDSLRELCMIADKLRPRMTVGRFFLVVAFTILVTIKTFCASHWSCWRAKTMNDSWAFLSNCSIHGPSHHQDLLCFPLSFSTSPRPYESDNPQPFFNPPKTLNPKPTVQLLGGKRRSKQKTYCSCPGSPSAGHVDLLVCTTPCLSCVCAAMQFQHLGAVF